MTARNEAKIEITASTARLPAGLRSALKQMQGFVAQTTGLMSKTDKVMEPDQRSLARGVMFGGIASNLATRGIDVMVDQTREVFAFQEELMRLGIAGRIAKGGLDAVGTAARGVSSATGLSALEVLKGGRAYLDLAGAQDFSAEKMAVLARAAQATGSDSKDLAGVMYQLTRSMGITDIHVMEETLGGLANQAKDGAIEMREMSKEFAGMMPLAARFGMKGREGAIQLGAMYQVMRDGFNSASEAATGMERILAGIPSHASKFEAAGVRVWNVARDGTKSLRTWPEIFHDIQKSGLMKDPEKLKKAFGRTEGWRGFMLLVESLKRLDHLTESGWANGVIAEDLATVTESATGRINVAVEKVKNQFAEMLTPSRVNEIVGGIQQMADAMPPLIHAAGVAADALATLNHWRHKASRYLSGHDNYVDTPQEWELRRRLANDPDGKELFAWESPEERARAVAIEKRDQDYGEARRSITKLENDFGPTDASIRRALAIKGAPNPDEPGGDFAAGEYLASEDIQPERLKRIKAEIAEEQRKAEEIRLRAAGVAVGAWNLSRGLPTLYSPSGDYFEGGGRGPGPSAGAQATEGAASLAQFVAYMMKDPARQEEAMRSALNDVLGARLDQMVRLLGGAPPVGPVLDDPWAPRRGPGAK